MGSNKILTSIVMISMVLLSVSTNIAGRKVAFLNPADCFASIKKVDGCADAVSAILRWDFSHLKHACCDAVEGIAEDCWPVVFPRQPFVHMMIKGICIFP
ncbi:unnamed protein product [Microthlaspi erraticum]|uniref:Prolamin-like domain-containing protein n=1 Tax=Microthlaspi erraticum TaxID=1685480 RepID=A0A6D2I290_9BRAS|nr:unnamed protein product [Microthlaspi erraticum]CAA7022534.1 unnamed protein product [Microthlaspi erraticum]CAA7035145.1 unnamed protein product [Microthlaspi erraticum]CAA7035147.1 unnamed protein product [Microthlaspi erraticum]